MLKVLFWRYYAQLLFLLLFEKDLGYEKYVRLGFLNY